MTLRRRVELTRTFVAQHARVHDTRTRTRSDTAIAAFAVLAAGTLLATAPAALAPEVLVPALALVAAAAVLAVPRVRPSAGACGGVAAGIARAWYAFLLVPLLYALLPRLNSSVHNGRYFDHVVQEWELTVFGHQPAARLAVMLPLPWASEILHAAYLSYYVLIWMPALICYLHGRMRGFVAARDAFVIASLLCFVSFIFFPVQGPRYLWPAPAADVLGGGTFHALTHAILERGSSRGAAFPSGHVAVAMSQVVVAWRYLPGHRTWITLTAVLLSIGTVYGGFHYALDAIAGALLGGLTGLLMVRVADGRASGASGGRYK